jgi:hypothetical protein
MAKKKVEVVKSDEVKRVLAERPDATAKEVVETLKEQGITISDALVYAVKKKLKPGTKKAPAPKTPAKLVAPSSNGRIGVGASIGVARAAAEKVGGLAALKEIVDALQ